MQCRDWMWERDVEPVEIPRRVRELREDDRFNHLVVPVVKDYLAILVHPDGIVSVMQQRVMPIAQHKDVVSVGLPTIDPVPDVVGCQVSGITAAGKTAGFVSAFQRLQQERWHDSVLAAEFQEHPLVIFDVFADIRITGDSATGLLRDRGIPLKVISRGGSSRCQLVAIDMQHHLVALMVSSPLSTFVGGCQPVFYDITQAVRQ